MDHTEKQRVGVSIQLRRIWKTVFTLLLWVGSVYLSFALWAICKTILYAFDPESFFSHNSVLDTAFWHLRYTDQLIASVRWDRWVLLPSVFLLSAMAISLFATRFPYRWSFAVLTPLAMFMIILIALPPFSLQWILEGLLALLFCLAMATAGAYLGGVIRRGISRQLPPSCLKPFLRER
jgi:hypothetical protein